MSGADLANLLNEGAIVAARQNKSEIDSDDIFNALERIALGLEKKDAVMSEQRRRLVAYHEAGHAILGALVNDYDAVAKISIVPRGPAGGVTIFMPSEERLNSGKVRNVTFRFSSLPWFGFLQSFQKETIRLVRRLTDGGDSYLVLVVVEYC